MLLITCTADTWKPGLVWERAKSLPKDKILNETKWNVFADDTLNVPQMIENMVGKGENAGYQPFLLYPRCFQ